MTIVEGRRYVSLTDPNDPDDYRPNSEIALVIDPSRPDGGFVRNLSLLFEHIAPGDRIPLHQHTIEEGIVVDDGDAEVRVGSEVRRVGPGAVVFIPPGTPHATRNVGAGPLSLHGIFASDVIPIEYLERNPAPGTEGRPPRPPLIYDLRELLEGDPTKAIRAVR